MPPMRCALGQFENLGLRNRLGSKTPRPGVWPHLLVAEHVVACGRRRGMARMLQSPRKSPETLGHRKVLPQRSKHVSQGTNSL